MSPGTLGTSPVNLRDPEVSETSGLIWCQIELVASPAIDTKVKAEMLIGGVLRQLCNPVAFFVERIVW